MSATMHHPSFGPPPVMSADECETFYGLRLCDKCDATRGVRDYAIPGWDETPRLLCEDCGQGEDA